MPSNKLMSFIKSINLAQIFKLFFYLEILNKVLRYYYIFLLVIIFSNSIIAQIAEVTINISNPENIIIGDSFPISITINKGNLNSFAKVQLKFPEGIIPELIESENAKFIFKDKKAKFIWDQLPQQSKLTLKMKIKTANSSEGIKEINGVFAYLEDSLKKEIQMQKIVIKLKNPIIVSDLTTNTSISTNKKINSADNTVNKSNIEYRIQIAAANSNIKLSTLVNKFSITKTIEEEIHNGMFKYTIGNYVNYSKAKEQQSHYRTNNGIKDAFITSYINGKRIPINDAISRTK